jgi:histidinol-phosphate/aromatic aminotransferase/cobyric acid decarboxylase-like protein
MATGRRTDWSRIARPSLAGIEPYDPGETRDEVKDRLGLTDLVPLNWNEDLFGPPQHVLDAAAAEIARAPLYP